MEHKTGLYVFSVNLLSWIKHFLLKSGVQYSQISRVCFILLRLLPVLGQDVLRGLLLTGLAVHAVVAEESRTLRVFRNVESFSRQTIQSVEILRLVPSPSTTSSDLGQLPSLEESSITLSMDSFGLRRETVVIFVGSFVKTDTLRNGSRAGLDRLTENKINEILVKMKSLSPDSSLGSLAVH